MQHLGRELLRSRYQHAVAGNVRTSHVHEARVICEVTHDQPPQNWLGCNFRSHVHEHALHNRYQVGGVPEELSLVGEVHVERTSEGDTSLILTVTNEGADGCMGQILVR